MFHFICVWTDFVDSASVTLLLSNNEAYKLLISWHLAEAYTKSNYLPTKHDICNIKVCDKVHNHCNQHMHCRNPERVCDKVHNHCNQHMHCRNPERVHTISV